MFNVGERIRYFRNLKNLASKEIAISIGVSPSFYTSIEKGRKKCSIENLEKICNVLNISLKDFFDVDTDKDELKPEIQTLIEISKKLNEDDLEILVRLANKLYVPPSSIVQCPHCKSLTTASQRSIDVGQLAQCLVCSKIFCPRDNIKK